MIIVTISWLASPFLLDWMKTAFTVQLGRVVRIFRLFKLVKRSQSLRTMFNTLYMSLPALLNIFMLLVLLGFVYQIVGLHYYSDVKFGEGLTPDCNFRELTPLLILLARVLTGDWWQIMLDTWTVPPMCTRSAEEKARQPLWQNPVRDYMGREKEWSDCGGLLSPAYFISFILLSAFMMLNLLLAVIMDKFSVAYNLEHAPINPKHLLAFRDAWTQFDSQCVGFLPLDKIEPFVRTLNEPLVPQQISDEWLLIVSAEWNHDSVRHRAAASELDDVTGEAGISFQDLLEILIVHCLGPDRYLTFKARKQRRIKFDKR
jgi:hypothetical protein